jgi:hypothetical protein
MEVNTAANQLSI